MSLRDLIAVFDALDAEQVSPDISMPAALPLELSGESVRPRLCIFPGPAGAEYALRADFTLPVAQVEAERRQAGAFETRTYAYDGPVFRLPSRPGEAVEFRQLGFEQYGQTDRQAADKRALDTLIGAVQAARMDGLTVRTGDLALMPALIDALGLVPEVANALKRAFRQPGGMTALLSRNEDTAGRLAERLAALPESEARSLIEETMAVAGISSIGTRGMDEVVERLIMQGRGAVASRMSNAEKKLLQDFAAINVPAVAAADKLSQFLAGNGLELGANLLEQIAARQSNIPADLAATFTPIYGRQFTYYDGFVFDIFKSESCLGGGGRYDSLLSHLTDGQSDAAAVGGALRMDRVMTAIGDGQ